MKKITTILIGMGIWSSFFLTSKVFAITTPMLYVDVSDQEVIFTWSNDEADMSAVYISKKDSSGRYVLVYDGDEELIYGKDFSCSLDVGEYRANMRSWSSGVPSGFSNIVYFTVENQNLHLKYYPGYNGNSNSIVDALNSMGISKSFEHREKIAVANGINNYTGKDTQNIYLLNLLKEGKLIDPDEMNVDVTNSVNDRINSGIGDIVINPLTGSIVSIIKIKEKEENIEKDPNIDPSVDQYDDWRTRLKLKYFKENIYWNHNGLPYSTTEEKAIANAGYSTERCYCSDHKHYYNEIKECTCNWYNTGSQCVGFAGYIFNDIWGVDPDINSMLTFTNTNMLKPGDLIAFQYTNDPSAEYKWHYAIVLEIGKDNVSVLECNYGDNCIIKYGNIHYMSEMTRYSTPFYYSVQ